MRISIVISSLHGGGAERVAAVLANAWTARHDITLITTGFQTGDDLYLLSDEVKRIRLSHVVKTKSFFNQIKRFLLLRKNITATRPDIVVSFQDELNVVVLLTLLGKNIPIIVCERNNPVLKPIRSIYAWLRKLLYPKADLVTVLTDDMEEDFLKLIPSMKTAIAPSPLSPAISKTIILDKHQYPDRERILAMGSLTWQKGFDRLITSFASISPRIKNWDLWIWGEGALREQLESQVAGLGLGDRVFLPGHTVTPYDEVVKSSIFVLSSRWEGSPNVLAEAMSLGRACVAFDCKSGPRFLSNNGEGAILVKDGDVEQLAQMMLFLAESEEDRSMLGEKAMKVKERFSLEVVLEIWEEHFKSVIKSK